MSWSRSLVRVAVSLATTAILVGTAACSSKQGSSPFSLLTQRAPAKLSLDAELSPVAFRWLADDAVLVPPKVGNRKLAAFGNYVARAAQKVDRARLSVWDDEAAWKLASRKSGGSDAELAHKRAEFVKDVTGPDPVERYQVFDSAGDVGYQRDFRAYPITELD